MSYMSEASIFCLPADVHVFCFSWLSFLDLLSLAQTCHYFLELSHDPALQPKTLDINQCSKYRHYLVNYLSDAGRRNALHKLIVPHGVLCAEYTNVLRRIRSNGVPEAIRYKATIKLKVEQYEDNFPRTAQSPDSTERPIGLHDVNCVSASTYGNYCCTKYCRSVYGIVETTYEDTPRYHQHEINIARILHDCPNIKHLCVPECRYQDLLCSPVEREEYLKIIHLETNMDEPWLLQTIVPWFRHLSSLNLVLDAPVFTNELLAYLPGKLTLTGSRGLRVCLSSKPIASNDFECESRICNEFLDLMQNIRQVTPPLYMIRTYSTPMTDALERLMMTLDMWKTNPSWTLHPGQLLDCPEIKMLSINWLRSILAERPFFTLHWFDRIPYDNRHCQEIHNDMVPVGTLQDGPLLKVLP